MSDLIFILGISAFVSLLITVLTGMRIIKVKHNIHKRLGLLTLLLASSHGGVIVYLQYFY